MPYWLILYFVLFFYVSKKMSYLYNNKWYRYGTIYSLFLKCSETFCNCLVLGKIAYNGFYCIHLYFCLILCI